MDMVREKFGLTEGVDVEDVGEGEGAGVDGGRAAGGGGLRKKQKLVDISGALGAPGH